MWANAISAVQRGLSAFNSLAFGGIGSIIGASGPVWPIVQKPRSDGALISERDRLANEYRTARRQHRPSRAIYSRARDVTHGILSRGQQWTR